MKSEEAMTEERYFAGRNCDAVVLVSFMSLLAFLLLFSFSGKLMRQTTSLGIIYSWLSEEHNVVITL
jgi:hypothetical protein